MPRLAKSLESDTAFLRIVIGLKRLPGGDQRRILSLARSVPAACNTSENSVAKTIADTAQRLLDREPAPELERKMLLIP